MIESIRIHDRDTGKVRIIKSGDNKAWKRLSSEDKRWIKEVLKQQRSIAVGSIVYEPAC
tara:strand:- start:4791 stop:4967 length:177 start_codon:yes stop_codon:yes gene_type:complete